MMLSSSKTRAYEGKNVGEQHNFTNCVGNQMDMIKASNDGLYSIGDNGSFHSIYKATTVSLKYESTPGLGRYVQSLKHLLPIRVRTGPGSHMPVDMSGCCAFTFFSWLTPLVWRTFRRGISESDLYQTSQYDSCKHNLDRFHFVWEREVKMKGLQNNKLLHHLFAFIRTRFILSCIIYALCLAFGFVGPTIFLRFLLEYIQSPDIDHAKGSIWMAGLLLSELLRIICFGLLWAINIRTAIRASSAVKALLYKKITSLRTITSTSVGELINLFANDCQKVFTMVASGPLLVGGPLVIVGAFVYTWWLLGPFCFISMAVFLISYLIQLAISYIIAHFRKQAVKASDERVSLMSEFLNNIKLIKLYAWERPLIESVSDARENERKYLERCQYLLTFSSSIAAMSASIATIFTILTYTLCGYDLTPAEAFTLVMINTIASHGIKTLPMCIRDIVNGLVAISRLQTVLHLQDRESYINLTNSIDQAINVNKATLDWEQLLPSTHHDCHKTKKGEVNLTVAENEKILPHDDITPDTALVTLQSESGLPPALIDISFVIPKGKLVGICGTIGSGKSSLMAALLGQMRLLQGQVAVRGSIAYVSQQPWILNATLKENILFGQLFSSKRYYEAVYCCGLTEDIAALPGGDQTEIGEKGVTLSGGQKQRASLARAQYADKDLYLLDDPLSSVDAQVSQHIFHHCIKGALSGKTILLVTHDVKYLQQCNSILIMQDGHIIEQGTHEELSMRDSEYSRLIQILAKDQEVKEDIIEEKPVLDTYLTTTFNRRSRSKSPSLAGSTSEIGDDIDMSDGHLMSEEDVKKGSISWDTYTAYMQAAGGFIICALVVIWFILQAASLEFSKFWLSYWLSQGDGNYTSDQIYGVAKNERNISYATTSITANPGIAFYQLIYGLSVIMMFTVTIILGFLFTKSSLRASSRLHDNLLHKLFRSPMSFFDTTPIGRILNMFTRDIDEIDNHLPSLMASFLQTFMTIIFALLLVVVVYHYFLIPLVLIAMLFIFVQRLFRGIMRDLKRLVNVSQSPIYSHVGVTVQGLSTIKAFHRDEDFLDKFTRLVDQHTSPQYLFHCSIRWLGTRMDMLCLLITLVIGVFVICFKGEVSPAFSALALTLALQLSGMYQFMVRLGCDLETRFTSVERIHTDTEKLEAEAPTVIEKTRPSPDWPTRGQIIFKNVKMRYRRGLPSALEGLSFHIDPQEKIGIVGRTGSGKSSIGTVLFRLVELQSGSIHIDGINIKNFGLEDLRSKMSIIPQDPVLFQGTVRYNLDPLNDYEDEQLWMALDRTHMKDKISSMNGGLNAAVIENGANFSVGEKQLICMARALLKHSKVVLLDEATASVDSETDKLIQKTIQQVFADSTVLTIAHRLTTVVNCHRVMVLSEGKIVEFEEPRILLDNPKSHFYQLMSAYKSSDDM